MAADLRPLALKHPDYVDSPEFMVRFFIETVRANLHMVLCFSPGL